VDDFRCFFTKKFHGALELRGDQLVVGSEHIDDPVEIGRFPGMVGKVACSVNRSTVAPADNVLVAKTEFLKIKSESLFIACLGEFFYLCDDSVGIPVADKITFPDEAVVLYIEVL